MVYSWYIPVWSINNWMTNLWIEGMEAPFRHVKGITSGTHRAPEQLRLTFHTYKGCQATVHDMGLQDIVQLSWRPTCTVCSPFIGFVGKAQLILHVLHNPLSQLCGQPAQGRARVGSPVDILPPRWRGCASVWHSQRARRILQNFNPAWFEKVEVKAYTTSRTSRAGLYIRVYQSIYTSEIRMVQS